MARVNLSGGIDFMAVYWETFSFQSKIFVVPDKMLFSTKTLLLVHVFFLISMETYVVGTRVPTRILKIGAPKLFFFFKK